jgi:hypothetical protein
MTCGVWPCDKLQLICFPSNYKHPRQNLKKEGSLDFMNVFIPYQGPVNDLRFAKSLLPEFSENNVTRKLQVEIETQYISQEKFPPPRLEKMINWVIGRGPVLTEDRSSKPEPVADLQIRHQIEPTRLTKKHLRSSHYRGSEIHTIDYCTCCIGGWETLRRKVGPEVILAVF